MTRVDSSADESFFSVRGDAMGRIFVGGRRSLFVYEPDEKGGYHARRLLYQFPDHTWINDIAVRGDDLYLLTVSALYLLPGGVTQREGLQAKRLVWGVPLGHVHQCFHALAWGPEGDLYLSMGDPVVSYGDFSRPDHWCHWTFFSQPDDTPTPYTGVGGVFRCRPDGSRFQVVARGMRNACGLAFDRHWNLFSNDNDHESIPELYVPGRLLHVTPRAEFFWPRGWMVEKTPDRRDLLDTLFAGMGRAVPVGQAYYDDDSLPAGYRDNLLVARWCTRSVTRYPLQRRGASFKAEEQVLLACQNDARPVGVSVARGGRIFVTVAYMAHNEGSPVYKSDLLMIARSDEPATHPFKAIDLVRAEPKELWAALSSPSWSRREAAHTELLRRGRPILGEASSRLRRAPLDDPAREHLIWLAAAGNNVVDDLVNLARDDDANVRLQAVRALAEFAPPAAGRAVFLTALGDSDPQVQHAALLAFFSLDGALPNEVLQGPARGTDRYLRQSAALLLAERASSDQLAQLNKSTDAAGRLACVLAAGFRLTVPPAARPVASDLPLSPLPADEQYVIQFADKKIDLRKHARIGSFTVAEHWRAKEHSADQERLFALLLARLGDDEEAVRLQAAHFLRLLGDARSEPAVAKVVEESEERRLAVAPLKGIGRVWLAGPFVDAGRGFATIHPPEVGPVDLSAIYLKADAKLDWKEVDNASHIDFARAFGAPADSSFYAYFRMETLGRERVRLMVGSDDGVKVWHNGREVWTNAVERAALPLQDVVPLALEPGSNDVLVRVQNISGECGLYLHYRALGSVGVRLPEKVGTDSLAERLKSAAAKGGGEVAPAFLAVDWAKAVAEADPAQGRRLFEKLACAKCHAVGADAPSTGGPSLADAGKRFTLPYLVESVLLPSKQISPVFRRTSLETDDGKIVTGLVVSETADRLELLEQDGTRRSLAKSEIVERALQDVSPMPAGIVKTPAELSELLAYLLRGE
ncbi:MAG TPA: HEAT repeat domain-containing protein [Pirellulales bacterium]|nr:HEAT repeat domain-containing protein [Pirellulales bacterium]